MKEEEKNLSLVKREMAGCLEVEQVVELAGISRYTPRYLQKVVANFDLSGKELQKLCEARETVLEEFCEVEGIEEICSLSSLAKAFIKLNRDPGRFEEFLDSMVYHLREELIRICIQAEVKFAEEERIKKVIKKRFSTAAKKIFLNKLDIAAAEEFYKEWEQAAAEAEAEEAAEEEEEGEEEWWVIEWGRKKKKKEEGK